MDAEEQREIERRIERAKAFHERVARISPVFAEALEEFDQHIVELGERMQREPENRAVHIAELESLTQQLSRKIDETLMYGEPLP